MQDLHIGGIVTLLRGVVSLALGGDTQATFSFARSADIFWFCGHPQSKDGTTATSSVVLLCLLVVGLGLVGNSGV